jgi:uncharacterized membrane protein YccC
MDQDQIKSDPRSQVAIAPASNPPPDEGNKEWLAAKDVIFAVEMTIACAISYWVITSGLARFVDKPSDFLGGMWAVVATVFVFRDTSSNSVHAGLARLIATCVSFCLCLFYLLLLPFHAIGLAALIGIGTVVMMLLDRREDIITKGEKCEYYRH